MFFTKKQIEKHVEDWLSWGGITHPSVMRQKDGSYMAVIAYLPYMARNIKINFPLAYNGWSIWIEKQHTKEQTRHYIAIVWYPDFPSLQQNARNVISQTDIVYRNNAQDYFLQQIQGFVQELCKATQAQLLEYQEILDFLVFSLSLDELPAGYVEMPDIPLDIDVLIASHFRFEFLPNGIKLNDKQLCVLSILGKPELERIFTALTDVSYRHVRRMLLFNETEAAKDLKKYTGKWCGQRKIVKELIHENLVKDINGYYSETFLFLLEEGREEFLRAIRETLKEEKILYIMEDYNLKDVFWGSLPGLYLANIVPLVFGLNSLDELLHTEKAGHADV